MFSAVVSLTSVVALVLLLTRAIQGGFVHRLPFFYSYISYMLLHMIVVLSVLLMYPRFYAGVHWFSFAIWQIVEFAVLIEISDHVFERYVAIRHLGRFLCGAVILGFGFTYVLPAFSQSGNASNTILELAKRAILTKAALVLVLLVAKRYYGLKLGKSISGLLLGFILYLGVNIANFELAEIYGRAIYAPVFQYVGPLAWTLGLLVWVAALWNYAPVVAPRQEFEGKRQTTSLVVEAQLVRFNDTLMKLLQK